MKKIYFKKSSEPENVSPDHEGALVNSQKVLKDQFSKTNVYQEPNVTMPVRHP